jgi:hypothetical protein
MTRHGKAVIRNYEYGRYYGVSGFLSYGDTLLLLCETSMKSCFLSCRRCHSSVAKISGPLEP